VTEPLEGVTVVVAARSIGAAYCCRVLVDAGAAVTIVEPPDGHPLRHWRCDGVVPAGSDGALFRYLHHGMGSVVTPAGEPDDALLAGADVLVTDSLDAADVAARHRHLVVLALTPWGLTGPDAQRPASELVVQAESGALAIRGRAPAPPFQAGGLITDWVSGIYAATAIAAALRQRGGQLIDLAQIDVACITGTNFADLFDSLRGRPEPTGPARTIETPSVEPTLDGYVGFNTNTRQQFDDFCVLIERPDLLEHPEWAAVAARVKRWDEWNEIVHTWTTKHTTAEIVELAAAFRIPCAPVADAEMLLAVDHVVDRAIFSPDPTGEFLIPRRPWTIDGEPAPARGHAPALGAGAAGADEGGAPVPRHDRALPLDGIRIVDLTAWWAGPSATGVLATLGADVIHVESITRPDGMRMAGGMFFGQPAWWERSAFFLQANTNKRGLTLDLTNDEGRELLLRLIETADVVVENFTPRVMESFRLSWDVLHAQNPNVVLVRMPAFGLTGPWRDRPGFAQTMEQLTGLAWLTGFPEDQPRIQRGPCDPNGGMHAAFATLAALAHRDRTGTGCFVEATMFEAALAIAAELSIEWTAYGTQLEREGNRSPHAAPQNLYATAQPEEWLAVSVTNDEEWRALCGALGRDDWVADARLGAHLGRRAHHDELDSVLSQWAAARTIDDALAVLQTAGVPSGRAWDPRRVHCQPQMRARGLFEEVDHPLIGPHPTPVLPFRMPGVDRWTRRHAPTMGEHNAEILRELGLTDADLERLTNDGIIGTEPAGL
jgi:crotonobetainyl-CoA:carnitine CoA-transferase CaiB-like acyl-CoA transferase